MDAFDAETPGEARRAVGAAHTPQDFDGAEKRVRPTQRLRSYERRFGNDSTHRTRTRRHMPRHSAHTRKLTWRCKRSSANASSIGLLRSRPTLRAERNPRGLSRFARPWKPTGWQSKRSRGP